MSWVNWKVWGNNPQKTAFISDISGKFRNLLHCHQLTTDWEVSTSALRFSNSLEDSQNSREGSYGRVYYRQRMQIKTSQRKRFIQWNQGALVSLHYESAGEVHLDLVSRAGEKRSVLQAAGWTLSSHSSWRFGLIPFFFQLLQRLKLVWHTLQSPHHEHTVRLSSGQSPGQTETCLSDRTLQVLEVTSQKQRVKARPFFR